ncbi:MAG: ABC transporter substrate-binding protein [Azospirillum sp.]|nr:ABC transporter substrate-binding protein [Azospirillum sp.]
MRVCGRVLTLATVAAACLLAEPAPSLAVDSQFVGLMPYRTGPYAPNGIPFADGVADYLQLINVRDGGINGVPISTEECDTSYNTDRGVECYERLKNKGATGSAAFIPLSTGITYALIERAAVDKVPLLTTGYGRTAGGDGRVFPYVFTLPDSYWSGADVAITYVAQQMGGFDKLKGKKIAFVYHDSPYGKEPIPVFEALAAKYGFQLSNFPVAHPGLEQKAVWLRIGRQLRPDWTIMWGWGVMNSTAIKEAAAVGYNMEHFLGVWWSGAEPDVIPAGDAAKGYKALAFHAPGADFKVIQDVEKFLYAAGKGTGDKNNVGTVLYNRGIFNSVVLVEAIRNAMNKFGNKPMTGEQIQWGFENLDMTSEKLASLGLAGFMQPFKITCADHEASVPVRVQQWDGKQWTFVSDWIQPDRSLIRPMIEAAAEQYAKEKNITPRDCK